MGSPAPDKGVKKRKKTDTPNEGWDEDIGSPPARAGFWKDDQGDRWGSPAPDKGHDRLAARCAVDSHKVKERKKENRQPTGGMGERHAATTQGF